VTGLIHVVRGTLYAYSWCGVEYQAQSCHTNVWHDRSDFTSYFTHVCGISRTVMSHICVVCEVKSCVTHTRTNLCCDAARTVPTPRANFSQEWVLSHVYGAYEEESCHTHTQRLIRVAAPRELYEYHVPGKYLGGDGGMESDYDAVVLISICGYIYVHIYIYTNIRIYMYTCIYIHIYICMYIYTYIFIHICICICVRVCVCIYVYTYVCVQKFYCMYVLTILEATAVWSQITTQWY